MTSVDELQKALKQVIDELNNSIHINTLDGTLGINSLELRLHKDKLNHFEGLFSAFLKGFETCEYVNVKGEPAFLCAPCRNYHGFKRGCEWTVSGIEEK